MGGVRRGEGMGKKGGDEWVDEWKGGRLSVVV